MSTFWGVRLTSVYLVLIWLWPWVPNLNSRTCTLCFWHSLLSPTYEVTKICIEAYLGLAFDKKVFICVQSSMAGLPQQGVAEQENQAIPGLRHTVWDQNDQRVEYPKLQQDMSTDVVIVGAGIAGLSVAYNLVKQGKKVVVLESRCRGIWKQHQILPSWSLIFVKTWNLLFVWGGTKKERKQRWLPMSPPVWIMVLLYLWVRWSLNVSPERASQELEGPEHCFLLSKVNTLIMCGQVSLHLSFPRASL